MYCDFDIFQNRLSTQWHTNPGESQRCRISPCWHKIRQTLICFPLRMGVWQCACYVMYCRVTSSRSTRAQRTTLDSLNRQLPWSWCYLAKELPCRRLWSVMWPVILLIWSFWRNPMCRQEHMTRSISQLNESRLLQPSVLIRRSRWINSRYTLYVKDFWARFYLEISFR